MANKVDKTITALKNKPIFAGLSTLFGTVASAGFLTATNSQPLFAASFFTALASPVVNTGLTIQAGVNLFRERSKLSKAFSAAAAITGISGLGGFAHASGLPGAEALGAYLITTFSMAATGALNLLAHYTRRTNLTIDISADKNEPPKP